MCTSLFVGFELVLATEESGRRTEEEDSREISILHNKLTQLIETSLFEEPTAMKR